jgi:hypothetical protein
MITKAAEQGMGSVTICEDDVEFTPGWDSRFAVIKQYLATSENWDIFSGLIANLHVNTEVIDMHSYKEIEFVHIDKMTSTVLNCYHSRIFDRIQSWDENYRDADLNTIDRYLESGDGLRVVTTNPFLVSHKEELDSTLWGFNNQRYSKMISDSVDLLIEKIRIRS